MTADQDLSARLSELHGRRLESAHAYSAAISAIVEAYRSGQLITVADHTAAVQAAVESALDKSREQDERGQSEGLLITALRHQLDMADAVAKAVEAERARTQVMHRRAQQAEGAIQVANNWLKWFELRLTGQSADGFGMYGRWIFREMVKALGRDAIRARKGDAL